MNIHTHTPIVDFGPDIPIFTKLYSLYRAISETLPSFPKTQRYSLGERLDRMVLDILELLFFVPISPSKLETLQTMSVKVDLLKVLLRLAKDTKALSSGRYLTLQEMLQEIGKMLGGWIRTAKQTEKP
ncbi:MAG: diversity-generating retroelement protein Avd [Candidatus Uhrbacteria bacterium]|nr:diversity-generating retroelement protein Avd [Candidatus Uhrbacteria bacterium]